MSSKGGKNKRAKRMPAIVPRFLKGIATIGAIPTLAAACEKGPPHAQPPVVAQYSAPVVAQYVSPPVVAAFMPADARQPDAAVTERPHSVVAAYVHRPPPPPVARDAGVAPKKSAKKDAGPEGLTGVPTPPPPPPVVAAYAPPDPGPPVVAAYVPHPTPSPKPKTKKQ